MAKMTLNQLQNELSGLDKYQRRTDEELRTQAEDVYRPQYERDLKMLQDNIEQNVAAQDRSAIAKGMQRSSYNAAQDAIIRSKGLETQANLGAQYEGNVASALLQLIQGEDAKEQAADQQRNNLLLTLYNYGKSSGGGRASTTPPPVDNGDGTNGDASGLSAAAKDWLNFQPNKSLPSVLPEALSKKKTISRTAAVSSLPIMLDR